MATTNLVNVEEYLHSTFEPDAEYVEGRIVYRALPQKTHSKTQSFFDRTLHQVGHPYRHFCAWRSCRRMTWLSSLG